VLGARITRMADFFGDRGAHVGRRRKERAAMTGGLQPDPARARS